MAALGRRGVLSLAGSLATAARKAATTAATTNSSRMRCADVPRGLGRGGLEAMQRRWMGGMPDRRAPVYLVFGASGGIGSALVEALGRGAAGGGARVVLAGLHEDKLEAVAERATAAGGGKGGEQGQQQGQCEVVTCDALKPEEVESAVQGVVSRHGRLDGVASLVGNVVSGSATTTSLEDFRKTLDVNLITAFNVAQAATKALLNQPGGGSIVLVSAAVAHAGIAHFEAMSAAKAGVEGLARAVAATYAPQGIRVNCVAPGLTPTRQTKAYTQGSPAVRDASTDMVPARRLATLVDVAAAMAFFLSPHSEYVTGQVLAIDGGLSTLQPHPAHADTK